MEYAVSLDDLVNVLQTADTTSTVYIDKTKGTIISIVEDGEDPGQAAARPLESNGFERCPVPSEQEERGLAQSFCDSLQDVDNRRRLTVALNNASGLDAFLTALYRCGIAHEWFQVRDRHLIQFAKAWLEARAISYVNDIDSGSD